MDPRVLYDLPVNEQYQGHAVKFAQSRGSPSVASSPQFGYGAGGLLPLLNRLDSKKTASLISRFPSSLMSHASEQRGGPVPPKRIPNAATTSAMLLLPSELQSPLTKVGPSSQRREQVKLLTDPPQMSLASIVKLDPSVENGSEPELLVAAPGRVATNTPSTETLMAE